MLNFSNYTSSGWTKNGSFPSTNTLLLFICNRIFKKINLRLFTQVVAQSSIMSEYNIINIVDFTNFNGDRTLILN